MKAANVPSLGARYWTALVLASVLGTNTGDFAAHDLGLGHVGGLLPLAILFGAILVAERRARFETEAFYWAAIVTLRTGATNIADFADHDLHLAPLLVIALLLAGLVATDRDAMRALDAQTIPVTGARYWTVMLLAGVIGTALGDYLADDIALTPGPAALVTLPVAGAFLALRGRPWWRSKAAYWVCVVAARTAGTNVGDWLAADDGLAFGLAIATTISASVFCAVLAVRRFAPRPLPAAGAGTSARGG